MKTNPYNAKYKGTKNKNKPKDRVISDVASSEKLLQRSSRFLSTSPPTALKEETQIQNEEGEDGDDNDAVVAPSCTMMCSASECIERERCLDVHPLEADDMNGSISYETIASNVHRKIDPAKAVKKFRRPAAGAPPPKASEIRTPETIMKTLAFLMGPQILGRADVPLSVRAAFIRDRGRALRSDLSRQIKKGREAIIVGLAMARFHGLIAHELCEEDRSDFDPFQNGEQLSKTLTTLGDLTALMRHPDEIVEFKAMKILTRIEDFSLPFAMSTTPPSGVEAWAYSLLVAFHTKDIAGWLRRAIAGPPNCSEVTALVLSSFALAHLNRMRVMLLEQLYASFSIPMPQSIAISDLFEPFGFADVSEASVFFSQFDSFHYTETGPCFKFSKELSFPETILPARSKLFSARLSNIAPSEPYENALMLAISTTPEIHPLVHAPLLSKALDEPRTDKRATMAPENNTPIAMNLASKSDLVSKANSVLEGRVSTEDIVNTIDTTISVNLSKRLINETMGIILRPFISSALLQRESYISMNISKAIIAEIYKKVFMDQFVSLFRKNMLIKRTIYRWRKFMATKNLSSNLFTLLPTHSEEKNNTILSRLPLLLQGRLLDFHSMLFNDCKFNGLPFRIVLLDWSAQASIPPLNSTSTDATISILSIYKCKDLCSQWMPSQFSTKCITLIIALIEPSVAGFNALCKQLRTLRSTRVREDVDLLFVTFIIKKNKEANGRRSFTIPEHTQMTRIRASKLIGISLFHVNFFSIAEIDESSLVDWLKPSLSLLLVPGGTAWIESDLIFQELANSSTLIEAIIDSDFAAFFSETKTPTIDLWKSSKWYRRYVIVDVAKMQIWERGI